MAVYTSATSMTSSLTSLFSEGSLPDSGYSAGSIDKCTPSKQTIPTPESLASDPFAHRIRYDPELEAYVEFVEGIEDGDASDGDQQDDDEDIEQHEPIDEKVEAKYRLDAVKQLRTSLTTNYTRSVDRYRALKDHAKEDSHNEDDVKAYFWQYPEDIPELTWLERKELALYGAQMNRTWFRTETGEIKCIAEEQQKLFGDWRWPKDDNAKASWPIAIGPKNEVVEQIMAPPKGSIWENLRQDAAVSLRSTKDEEIEPPLKKKPRLRILPLKKRERWPCFAV